ncbi:hypothetical protein EYF80_030048 [Liparis tanakae]|uniref:Uncharacterized protein n=1 Tax=Liparis tanakae TaxID=230148 RepID=A0A4Z2H1B6_9TELE|nr:hypothetical protein EYF80_030048 [Liparis tanakae]
MKTGVHEAVLDVVQALGTRMQREGRDGSGHAQEKKREREEKKESVGVGDGREELDGQQRNEKATGKKQKRRRDAPVGSLTRARGACGGGASLEEGAASCCGGSGELEGPSDGSALRRGTTVKVLPFLLCAMGLGAGTRRRLSASRSSMFVTGS